MAVYHFSRLAIAKYHKLDDLKQQVCRLTVLEACCCYLVVKSHPILCYLMDCNMSGHPVPHHLLEFSQIHVRWISDAIQPSHPLLPSFPAFNLFQHQGLFQWVSSLHQVAKVLELQFQHQFFQWLIRVDCLYDWLVWSPSHTRDSQESSPAPQFGSITFIWKNPKGYACSETCREESFFASFQLLGSLAILGVPWLFAVSLQTQSWWSHDVLLVCLELHMALSSST